MQTLSRTARLVSAATAAVTTLVLFSAVISISEPQRSMLMAKTEAQQQVRMAQAKQRDPNTATRGSERVAMIQDSSAGR